jgi:hypothetical protein
VLNPATNQVYYVDENPHQNRYYDTQQQVGIVIPFDPKHGFAVSVRDLWGAANWYENQPGPWQWDADIVFAATKSPKRSSPRGTTDAFTASSSGEGDSYSLNVVDGVRVNTGIAYLTSAV